MFLQCVQIIYMKYNLQHYPALIISKLPGVFQLIGQRQLDLGQLTNLALSLFQLPEKVGIFNCKFLFWCIKVVEGAVGFIKFWMKLIRLVLQLLDCFLTGRLEKLYLMNICNLQSLLLHNVICNCKIQTRKVDQCNRSIYVNTHVCVYIYLFIQREKKCVE